MQLHYFVKYFYFIQGDSLNISDIMFCEYWFKILELEIVLRGRNRPTYRLTLKDSAERGIPSAYTIPWLKIYLHLGRRIKYLNKNGKFEIVLRGRNPLTHRLALKDSAERGYCLLWSCKTFFRYHQVSCWSFGDDCWWWTLAHGKVSWACDDTIGFFYRQKRMSNID